MAAMPLVAVRGRAQEAMPSSMSDMDQNAYRPVRLPPKPGAQPQLTDAQRDDLEHHIHCQCGCGQDVYTCRTTDFSCQVSPAMHTDVLGLVTGGYDAKEILAAFRKVYGERVLMEPAREGFNWLAYILPFGAVVAGGAVVLTLLKHWTRATSDAAPVLPSTDATPEELERLRKVLGSDE